MNKLDEYFWSELRQLREELLRVQPQPDPPPGRLRWLKRIVLQVVRPLAVPQMDFNRHLLARLDRIEWALRLMSDRFDAMDESAKGLDKAMEKFTAGVREALESHGRKAPETPSPSAGGPAGAGTPVQAPSLREALERGFYLQNVSPGRFNVLDEIENWDVLMVLDACRYDAFERVWRPAMQDRLPGELHRRISVGSHTSVWLKETLRGREADASRIVYLATNPHVSEWYFKKMGIAARFAHVEELWKTRWDAREYTVMPEAVAEEYLRLRDQYPGRKFILHFLQPHTPYVGKTRLRKAPLPEMPRAVNDEGEPYRVPMDLALVEDSQASVAEGFQAYDDNLRRVLEAIIDLMPKVSQRAVITADHGELINEYGVFGHPVDLNVPELIEVPWFVCR